MEELVLEIMKIALKKNKKTTNTVFIDFAGHVNWLSIRIFTKGWADEKSADYVNDICLYKKDTAIEQLQKTLNYLKKLED